MAGTAEAWPLGEERDVSSEEVLALTEIDNFKALFEIHLKLGDGEEIPPESLLFGYQEYLKNDPNGQATSEALNQLRANPSTRELFEQAVNHLSEPGGEDILYELISRAAAHLPPGLGVEILHDPRLEGYDPNFSITY